MENNYFLVKWVNETPVRQSMMTSSDIVDKNLRNSDRKCLIDKEIEFKWQKKKICLGKILAIEMELKIKTSTMKGTLEPKKRKNQPTSGTLVKKLKIDQLVNLAENLEEGNTSGLNKKLEEQTKLVEDLTAENLELKVQVTALQLQIKNSTSQVDIGNGMKLTSEYLSTIKTASPTVNVFARSLFKKFFEPHEVIGYSLMGKKCNARDHEMKPPLDYKRRDAIIDYFLKVFGKSPGSEFYSLSLKDVKKSLSCLISEMARYAKTAEAQVIATDQNQQN